MKCSKCSCKNISDAKYCKKCGNEFTEKERKKAKRFSVVNILEKLEDAQNVFNMDFSPFASKTKNKILKFILEISSILIVLVIGIYFIASNGLHLKIQESNDYKVQFNKSQQEYYLFVNDDEAKLNLYVPNRAQDGIKVQQFDKDNKMIEETTYKFEDEITLKSNNENYYYIEVQYENNNLDRIKLFIYKNAEE